MGLQVAKKNIRFGVYIREIGKDRDDPLHFFRAVKEHMLKPQGRVSALYMQGVENGNVKETIVMLERAKWAFPGETEEALHEIKRFSKANRKSAVLLFGESPNDFLDISNFAEAKKQLAMKRMSVDAQKLRITPLVPKRKKADTKKVNETSILALLFQ